MNSLVIYICVALGVIWTGIMSVEVALTFLINPRWGHRGERVWAGGLCWLTGIKIRYEGIENIPKSGGVILAPKHASMFDILVMSCFPREFRYIAKRSLAKAPVLGLTLRVVGTYWVDRDRSGKDVKVMEEVENGLRKGTPVIIFPEGTRTRTGELLPFKKGAFRTALNAGVPILPIGLLGTYNIAPPGKLPNKRGHDVVVRIGSPFHLDPNESVETSMEKYRTIFLELLKKPKDSPKV